VSLAEKWLELEFIIFSQINQMEKNKYDRLCPHMQNADPNKNESSGK
jgi:hypothetical protein